MSNHFYLSHAAIDRSTHLQRFFEDLTYAIQIRLALPRDEQVGFLDGEDPALFSQWCPQVAEALRTSRTMVALLSPAYFRSEHTGKEWQVFETRRHLYTARRQLAETQRVNLPAVVAPVIWIPWQGQSQTPRAVGDSHQQRLGKSSSIYRKNGLLTMLESLSDFLPEYVEVVVALAEQVIDMAVTTELPPLDVLPSLNKVASAFDFHNELRFRPIDGFENGTKYKAVIFENDEQVQHFVLDCLGPSFQAKAYAEADAEVVLNEILLDESQATMPDLFIVDLELEAGEIRGLKLIEQLKANNVPAEIIAMSSTLSSRELKEVRKLGAADVLPKPFDERAAITMKTLAGIGMNRRLYRQDQYPPGTSDPSRQDRPVFLSYSNEDQATALILRRHIESAGIGVWYAAGDLQSENGVREHLLEAIDRVRVFVPLITDNYPNSAFCMAKMARFYRRRQTDKSAVLLPVLDGFQERMKNLDLIRPIIEENRYADITLERFSGGLTAMLGGIQKAIGAHQ